MPSKAVPPRTTVAAPAVDSVEGRFVEMVLTIGTARASQLVEQVKIKAKTFAL